MKLYLSIIVIFLIKNLIKSLGLHYSNIIEEEKKKFNIDMFNSKNNKEQNKEGKGKNLITNEISKENLKDDPGKSLNIEKLLNLKEEILDIGKNLDRLSEESYKLEEKIRKEKADRIMKSVGLFNKEISSDKEKHSAHIKSIQKNLRKISKERSEPGGEYEENNISKLPYYIAKNKGKSSKKKYLNFSIDPNILDKFNKVYELLKKEHHLPVKTEKKEQRNKIKCNLNDVDYSILRKIEDKPICLLEEVYDPILRLCVNLDCIPDNEMELENENFNFN